MDGDNAQGKTNILEAVYLAGTSKSHKGSKDREMIRFENEESHIRMIKGSCHQRAADPQGKGAAGGGESGVFFSGGS